jgi:two-component system OmpR family response regulator
LLLKNMLRHVLLVEDDDGARAALQRWFRLDGFRVTALDRGEAVWNVLSTDKVGLVILDIGLPDIDGLTLARKIREKHKAGIIIVSGRGDLVDKLVGLEAGADDYITKPFEPREILARARSVLRRIEERVAQPAAKAPSHRLAFDRWIIDTLSQTLEDEFGRSVPLTTGEYDLLHTFVTHANQVLSRDQLIEYSSRPDSPAFDRSVDVQIGRVRKKLGDVAREPRFIKTVRNGGYIFIGKPQPV